MDYKKMEMGSYNIHLIRTNKFKTITIKMIFKREAKKEEITMRNLLSDLLLRSSKKYHSERLLAMANEDLYGISYSSSVTLSGRYSLMSFDFTLLNEKYTEEGIFDKSFSFICDLLFDPNVQNKKFDTKAFELSKDYLKNVIESVKEDPNRYSMNRLFEEMAEGNPISYHKEGYLKDLEKITEKSLYEYYEEIKGKDLIDIFIIGDIQNYEIKKKIEKKFPIHTFKRKGKSHYIKDNKTRLRAKTVQEESDFTQSNLYLGYNIIKPTSFESNYVSYLYNSILGGGGYSRLFQNVREKNSLCYAISSMRFPLNEMFVIKSGISLGNFKKAANLIRKEIKNMALGKFEEEDVMKAKVEYIAGLKELMDNPYSILNMYVSKEYLGVDLIPEKITKMGKVTKKDIVNYAKKVRLNTIYFLKGGMENE